MTNCHRLSHLNSICGLFHGSRASRPGCILKGSSASGGLLCYNQYQPGLGLHPKAQVDKYLLPRSSVVVDRMQLPKAVGLRASLLAVGWRLVSAPCRGSLYDVAASFIRHHESSSRTEPVISSNLRSGIPSPLLSPLAKKKVARPAHTQGEGAWQEGDRWGTCESGRRRK